MKMKKILRMFVSKADREYWLGSIIEMIVISVIIYGIIKNYVL